MVYDIALQGDKAAVKVFTIAGHQLGIGLTNLVDIVSPTRVIVGGGIALAGDLLLEPARKVIRQRAFPPQNRQVEVVPAALGDLSGMYGAASMVFNDIRVKSIGAGFMANLTQHSGFSLHFDPQTFQIHTQDGIELQTNDSLWPRSKGRGLLPR